MKATILGATIDAARAQALAVPVPNDRMLVG